MNSSPATLHQQKHSQRRPSEIHGLIHAAPHHHTSDRTAAATADIYQTRALPELGRQRSAPVDSQQSASLEHFPLPAKVSTFRQTIKRNAHTRMKMKKMFICVHIFTHRYQTHSGAHTEKCHARTHARTHTHTHTHTPQHLGGAIACWQVTSFGKDALYEYVNGCICLRSGSLTETRQSGRSHPNPLSLKHTPRVAHSTASIAATCPRDASCNRDDSSTSVQGAWPKCTVDTRSRW